jgi:hypothetical protein
MLAHGAHKGGSGVRIGDMNTLLTTLQTDFYERYRRRKLLFLRFVD